MMHRWFLVAAVLLAASPLEAQDLPGVKLMRPDSLAGWDYGPQPSAGWTIAKGRLSGNVDSTPLLSGFSAGEFQLRFAWSVANNGVWKIRLPDVPSGKGIEIVLCEGEGCGRLTDGDQELTGGGPLQPRGDLMHTAAIRRTGGKLSLTVDGQLLYEIDVRPQRRLGLGLELIAGEGALAALRGVEPLGQSMFNGTDFAGWWTPGNLAGWKYENGEVVMANRPGNYLRTEKEYANFTLSLWYKMKKGGNSGLGIRTPRAGWPSSEGMELQWQDHPGVGKHDTMSIYGNVAPFARNDFPELWNHMVVKADGRIISAWINGELVQHCNTTDHPELRHRTLAGWIGFQDHGAWIRLRDVRLLEAPDGLGLEAWSAPRQKRATSAVVERLMNPTCLAVDDGIRSGTIVKTIAGPESGEHVLCELVGPGAVVRMARSNNEGRLAFYFDGEEQPRIETHAEGLRNQLPPLSEDGNPVLTCVTYQKSLKIVLREAQNTEHTIDYLTFPEGYRVDTFVDAKSGFPHGHLEPLIYRHQKYSWSARRSFEPLPQYIGRRETVGPGETAPLIHVEGAGIVQSLRLMADKRVLQNNDLWLEVTLDGEAQPAVAAPARFWFPGLVAGGSFHNFVMLQQNGLIQTLAMPFGRGITISVRNRGGLPIGSVGLAVTVEPRDDASTMMRLRGVFQPAEDWNDELICREGKGRWVGFVYQQPELQPGGIGQLIVDDVPRDAWTAGSFDRFLGQGGEFRKCLSGRAGRLQWRYLWLAPVDFERSLILKTTGQNAGGQNTGDRLALFYMGK